MQFRAAALLLTAAATAIVAEDRVSYDGFKVFRIEAPDYIEGLHEKLEALNTVELTCGHTDHLDIAVAPEDLEAFDELSLNATVLATDLGEDLATEGPIEEYFTPEVSALQARQALPALSWFNSYRPWAEHRTFWDQLVAAAPGNSRIFNVGNSFQGRQIYGFHLWGPAGQGARPAIYFHGTVHAREWISPAVVEYIGLQLVSGWNSNDATVRSILTKYDVYIVPFVNPDGFVYTQTTNRLWRKNRQTRTGTTCVGTDGNRNWNYQWSVPGGASTDPCSDTFKGRAAGDTPEIAALQTFTNTLRTRGVKLFVDWHSFGQYILLPYGYNCNTRAPNHAQQMTIAAGHASRVGAVYNTRWTYGHSCTTLYPSTGSSPDYMTGAISAEYAWTIELRPGPSSGTSGFSLAAGQILASGIEQWEGLKYVLTTI